MFLLLIPFSSHFSLDLTFLLQSGIRFQSNISLDHGPFLDLPFWFLGSKYSIRLHFRSAILFSMFFRFICPWLHLQLMLSRLVMLNIFSSVAITIILFIMFLFSVNASHPFNNNHSFTKNKSAKSGMHS